MKNDEPELFKTSAQLEKSNFQTKALGGGCLVAFVLVVFLALAGIKGGIIMALPALCGIGVYKMLANKEE